VVDAVDAAIGPKCRLAVVDHVSSLTALVLPVAAIAERCRKKGVPLLVDGAHAPGAVALDVPSLGVDYYAANLHKWAFAPRPSGFLWAAPARQAGLHPPVISWGLDEGFLVEFDWMSTRDPSSMLAAPEGIRFLRELGAEAVRGYNHTLALEAARLLASEWGTEYRIPESMTATMCVVPLPPALGSTLEDAIAIRDRLLFEERIEVQIHEKKGRLWTRISAQIYNHTAGRFIGANFRVSDVSTNRQADPAIARPRRRGTIRARRGGALQPTRCAPGGHFAGQIALP
jgi:isopenicillin-N epimerase